jgi:hypothetical protein
MGCQRRDVEQWVMSTWIIPRREAHHRSFVLTMAGLWDL